MVRTPFQKLQVQSTKKIFDDFNTWCFSKTFHELQMETHENQPQYNTKLAHTLLYLKIHKTKRQRMLQQLQ